MTVALLASCAEGGADDAVDAEGSRSPVGSPVLDDDVTRPLVEALVEAEGIGAEFGRLAEGLVPPTNTWFSGLVLADESQPIFPLPLSFALAERGVEFGVPAVSAQPGAISAPHAPTMVLDAGSDSAVVTAYDEVSVTITLAAGDEQRAEVTIARGSPVVGYTALSAHDVRLSAEVTAEPEAAEGTFTMQTATATFALVAPGASVSPDGLTISLDEGATATWVAVPLDAPPGALAELTALATSPIDHVTVAATADATGATTTLTYVTADGQPTVVGRLPHQLATEGGSDCALGEFLTVYGPMSLCVGPELQWSVPDVAPAGSLTVTAGAEGAAALSDDDRAELVAALEQDVEATVETPPDTYFGGKALGRMASLLQLARQLSDSGDEVSDRAAQLVEQLEQRLTDELRLWTEPQGCSERAERCFTYDTALKGIVGLAPSFGSDEFNDHHFHYGYFLYAAAVLVGATGADDDEVNTDLVAELRPVMDLLAADLASSGGDLFPVSRAFDPYSGHSWASGFSPFRDGNNQESSSEAVSAANGLALWAQAIDDAALAEQARWMLSAEAHSAQSYYTNFDRTEPPYADYDRGTVGIVWDAKRDFGTWFSGEPAAVLGIQLLPMHPMAGYLGGDGDRILANLAEAVPDGAENAPLFADALLMYQSLAGPQHALDALAAARELPAAAIDGGGSRAYLLAFIMAQR